MRFRAELKYTPEDMRRYDRVYKKMRYRALVPVMDVLLVLLLLSLFFCLSLGKGLSPHCFPFLSLTMP